MPFTFIVVLTVSVNHTVDQDQTDLAVHSQQLYDCWKRQKNGKFVITTFWLFPTIGLKASNNGYYAVEPLAKPFYAPASKDRGHIVLPLSVCLHKHHMKT